MFMLLGVESQRRRPPWGVKCLVTAPLPLHLAAEEAGMSIITLRAMQAACTDHLGRGTSASMVLRACLGLYRTGVVTDAGLAQAIRTEQDRGRLWGKVPRSAGAEGS